VWPCPFRDYQNLRQSPRCRTSTAPPLHEAKWQVYGAPCPSLNFNLVRFRRAKLPQSQHGTAHVTTVALLLCAIENDATFSAHTLAVADATPSVCHTQVGSRETLVPRAWKAGFFPRFRNRARRTEIKRVTGARCAPEWAV
jgi:hypothetical protein